MIGILVEAKRRRLMPAIRPWLDALRDQAGFRVRQTLYDQVLQDADE